MEIRRRASLCLIVTALAGLGVPADGMAAEAIHAGPAVLGPPAVIENLPHPHSPPVRRPNEAARPRTCFNPGETRDKIMRHGLGEPFRLLRGAAGHIQGEALRVKLCRVDEEYVYDISVLRRDGRLVHVFLNAVNGQVAGALNDR